MENVEKDWDYRLVSFFHKWLYGLSRKFNKAALELNFLKYKMKFGERDSDIYVISYPKSGTTMLQMILYQLTTDGSMDFKHIDHVAPWIKNEAFEKRAPRELQTPRIIKSHDTYSSFEHTKGRFIFIMRDGRDVAVSKYHQDKNYNNPKLKFNDFMESFFKEGKFNYFTFHREWIANRKKRRILYLTYEEVKKQKGPVLRKIADFCGLHPNEEDFARTMNRSSFDFMKQHEEKFGVKPPIEPKVYDQFIRKGQSGGWKDYFTEDQLQEFDKQFHKKVAPSLSSKES